LAVGKSHVTSRHLHQIADTAYDATIPALYNISTRREVVEFRWDTQNTQTLPY